MTAESTLTALAGKLPFRSNSKGRRLDPRELLHAFGGTFNPAPVESLAWKSILHAGQFTREQVIELAKLSAVLESTEIETRKPLDGKIAITAFFEPSTRTRLSFESAVQRLDGKILSVPDGQVTGIAKGESLADIGEMFNTYGDVVIMRHPETESVDEIGSNLDVPLINAGNGTGQHPSQALLDWYTLLKWRPSSGLRRRAREGPRPPRHRRHARLHAGRQELPAPRPPLPPGHQAHHDRLGDDADPVGLDLGVAVEKAPIQVDNTNDIQEVLGTSTSST